MSSHIVSEGDENVVGWGMPTTSSAPNYVAVANSRSLVTTATDIAGPALATSGCIRFARE